MNQSQREIDALQVLMAMTLTPESGRTMIEAILDERNQLVREIEVLKREKQALIDEVFGAE